MEAFLEILKYILPALVVFASIYFVMKRFFDQQYGLESLKYKQKQFEHTLPLKLQAYERLLMFCERISIPNLMLRLQSPNTTVEQLEKSMLIAIQQEYEHNLTQQMYVSESLWQIITMAKNQTSDIVSTAANNLNASDPGSYISREAIEVMKQSKANPLETAKRSIRKEVAILFA